MRSMLLSAALSALLLPSLTGCSTQNSQVARGQAPSATYVNAYGEDCPDDCIDARTGRCRFCRGRGCCYCQPYRVPRDLRYPPSADANGMGGDLPAIVQYPYYTCKGPDCFFKQ